MKDACFAMSGSLIIFQRLVDLVGNSHIFGVGHFFFLSSWLTFKVLLRIRILFAIGRIYCLLLDRWQVFDKILYSLPVQGSNPNSRGGRNLADEMTDRNNLPSLNAPLWVAHNESMSVLWRNASAISGNFNWISFVSPAAVNDVKFWEDVYMLKLMFNYNVPRKRLGYRYRPSYIRED